MEACLLVVAAAMAAAALLLPQARDRRGPRGWPGPRRQVRRVLGATLVAGSVVPAGLVAVLLVVRPIDAPLRFVHGSTVLGFWMAAGVLGACSISKADPWASPRAASAAAAAALVAASAAVFITPYDRFASVLPGSATILAAAIAALLVGASGVTATRGLRVARPAVERERAELLRPMGRQH